jgi:hypothetical protein
MVSVEHREYGADGKRQTRLRPDLRFTLPDHKSLTLIADVAVTHPAAAGIVSRAAAQPLAAAQVLEKLKQHKYQELAKKAKAELLAFVMESSGAFGRQADTILKILAKQVPEEERSQWAIDTRIALSVAVQRGNAALHRAGVEAMNSDWDAQSSGAASAVLPQNRIVAL